LHPCLAGTTIHETRPPSGGLEGYPGPDAVRAGKEGHLMADKYEAYCVKCREKREFEGEVVELKNGRKAAQGLCPVCGTKVMRILGKSAS
jgi:Zn finger protein HypA/HybF involved in hydrogenase expression